MTKPTIPFANLKTQYKEYKADIDTAMQQVIDAGQFIMGPQVKTLEDELAKFVGGNTHAIACASGTDALMLALLAIDIQPGDEVITTPFTFIATAEVIQLLQAKPIFVDIEPGTLNIDVTKIEEKITSKTKAIIPVSLYGQPCDMDEINSVAEKYSKKVGKEIYVIEDAAQSFGAEYKGKKSCGLSKLACTSFFPAKPFGCFGDGGAVFTADETLAKKIKCLSTHGQTKRYHHEYIGINGRLDTLQAAVLLAKLPHYLSEIKQRQAVAKKYDDLLDNKENFIKTTLRNNRSSVFAQYTIRVKNRDQVKDYLQEQGVPTAVHYPKPLHLQPCFSDAGFKQGDFPISEKTANEVLSLPMCAFTQEAHQGYIVAKLAEYSHEHCAENLNI
jgi:UDP-2-acetamido-2-deoxy-ribo-hexuluronate aminotransferase